MNSDSKVIINYLDKNILQDGVQSFNTFNPVDVRKETGGVEYLANLVITMSGVEVDDARKETLKNIIMALPDGATLATLVKAIKENEAEQLGVSPEIYETLMLFLSDLNNGELK
ncbi:TPA: hypothetical protein ACIVGF_002891 [Salmonella enterica subsp. enterica serovar 16:l,v:-]|nr:hypothetical protein [Salmonella enterica]